MTDTYPGGVTAADIVKKVAMDLLDSIEEEQGEKSIGAENARRVIGFVQDLFAALQQAEADLTRPA